MPTLLESLYCAGFCSDDEGSLEDSNVVAEAIRALMLRSQGLSHPYHEMLDILLPEMEIEVELETEAPVAGE